MIKIVTILGARPQFIKAAVLSRIIQANHQINEVIIHTGQHYDKNMSGVFFEEMQLPKPNYNLNVNGLSHGAMTGQMIEKIEAVLQKENPKAVVVYGDTNSTLAGALAAKKLNIKLIHIEAGLRSFNMEMPEEVNRILTDRISDLLICPTQTAIDNLQKEGFDNFSNTIVNHGDIMKDALLYYSKLSSEKSTIVKDLNLTKDNFVVATIHRQENTNDFSKLTYIVSALEEINTLKKVILPLHPRTKKLLEQYNINPTFTLIEPLGYFDMLSLLQHCQMVITDSGGLQKEAFYTNKFCIVVREETEWKELVEYGYASLTGSNPDKMIEAFEAFSTKGKAFDNSLYGKNVGESIYQEILKLLEN